MGREREEKTECLKSQRKWERCWPVPPLATPGLLNVICLPHGLPSSPAARGANVAMVRQPAVRMTPSRSAERLSADPQVRAAQLTDANKLLLWLAPRNQGGQESRETLLGHAKHRCFSAQLSGTLPFLNPSRAGAAVSNIGS